MTCECGRIAERTGKCASCSRAERKEEERAKRVKMVVKEIRKSSPKMAKALTEYSKLKKQFLAVHPRCQVYADRPAVDIHHMAGRGSVERLLDTNLWMAVSREAHVWIETHPKEAREKGYSLERLTKTI